MRYANQRYDHIQQLLDFGFAKRYEVMETTERIGSRGYFSPDVLRSDQRIRHDPRTGDMWACGVVLFAMLTKELPFMDDLLEDPKSELWTSEDKTLFWSHYAVELTETARNLLEGLMEFDASKRLTAEQALAHKFFT